ncbi:M28 family peptidase [Amycolatopsis albispora]|uniref:Peptidase M28 n=1 Tax=Amycolatopsis albispora TaxID=1804986 RepID=A0A344L5F1_9PSEU|nr:M28 family peptidase [Amycolatopsis albispora]AXB43275.1 peptidase M28 [Amycolatopsis albispora]
MRGRGLIVAVIASLVGAVPAVAAGPEPGWLAERLTRAPVGERALADLAAFDAIAAAHGGNREVGTPGFEESRRYVDAQLTAAGYQVTYQDVPYHGFGFDAERVVDSGGASPRVLMAQYAPSTPVGGLTAPVTFLATSGCSAAEYPPESAGTVVLSRTDGCTSAQHALAASQAGAAALLLYDVSPAPWTNLRRRTPGSSIPVGFLSQQDAEALNPGTVTVELRGHDIHGTTVNLFAETRGGRADNIVMAGAHLDGTPDGPGINDNGSSVAAVLRAAVLLGPYQEHVPNKVRFAFWGAEELVNVGSAHYIDTLGPAERDAITLYLNYEMLASSNYVRFVMDGDDSEFPGTGSPGGPPGSGQVEAVIAQGYGLQGVPIKKADFSEMRSDSEAFMAAGIPSGGAHGGGRGIKTAEEAAVFGGTAGQFYDPCYHQPCDDLAHIDVPALKQSVLATVWAVGRFAVYADDVRAASGR